MSVFRQQLQARNSDSAGRRWIYVPYDQLTAAFGPLAREDPSDLGIALIETGWKAARRPYHRQKLALVLANQRHFALEQAARGVHVRYETSDRPYEEVLRRVAADVGPLRVMVPAERELRAALTPLARAGALVPIAHEGWLTTREDFQTSQRGGPPWRMDAFYRHVRRRSGLLMKNGAPLGGKFSFDAENRRPWRGEPPAPDPPTFRSDSIKEEVAELVERRFARHPGRIDLARLPATAADADAAWRWARSSCLPLFGPFEDAMSRASPTLFHTLLAPLINLGRLEPRRLVEEAARVDIPFASKEGFVRQILGWREFMRHVHDATDGFRNLPAGTTGNALEAREPLPAAYWGTPSGLACLDHVVGQVWASAYSHHITRLMVLGNLATLLDVDPRQLTDWFWCAYADAYDWVVEPNVLGMGTFAMGDLMITKPYVSGAAYIARMSDYCEACAFDPKTTCPITRLYWAFLARHRRALTPLPRMRLPLAAAARRSSADRAADRATFARVRETLRRGELLTPDGHRPGTRSRRSHRR